MEETIKFWVDPSNDVTVVMSKLLAEISMMEGRLCISHLLVVTLTCAAVTAVTHPNIIIHLGDDLGIGDVGCYGNTTLETPNIDKLAAEGIKLTHHLATDSVCSPSRAALLTGRYPIRSGVASNGLFRVPLYAASLSGLLPWEQTFAEQAKEAGYRTAIIGKWHQGQHAVTRGNELHPLSQGFDFFYGFILTLMEDFGDDGDELGPKIFPNLNRNLTISILIFSLSSLIFYKRGHLRFSTLSALTVVFTISVGYIYISFNCFKLLDSFLMRDLEVVEQPIRLKGLTQRFAKEGIEFLEKRELDRKPFLLFMSWGHPHVALAPNKDFAGRTRHGRYGDSIEEFDYGIGEIQKALDRLGLADDTLVYFTSDHGGDTQIRGVNGEIDGGYNGIYKGGKSQGAADGAIRVPGVIRWPGRIQSNTTSDVVTSQLDIFPLISSLVGVPLPSDRVIDGRSMLDVLTGHRESSTHQFLFHYCGNILHAVRYSPQEGNKVWKLMYRYPSYLPGTDRCPGHVCSCKAALTLDPPVLYEMTSDPRERHPIKSDSSPEYAKIADVIDTAVKAHVASIKPVQNQFQTYRLLWLPHLQECCNFPFCKCKDPKYPDSLSYLQ